MLKKIISAVYIIALLALIIGLPVSAILIIIKLCTDAALPWIGACLPLIIAIAAAPFWIITKTLLDEQKRR